MGYEDIVKGYDLGGGDYAIVEPEELDEIAPGKSQVIESAASSTWSRWSRLLR